MKVVSTNCITFIWLLVANDTEGGDKRKRSHSPDRSRDYKRERRDEPPKMESLDWVESEDLTLDRYNCDLNIEVCASLFSQLGQTGVFGFVLR